MIKASLIIGLIALVSFSSAAFLSHDIKKAHHAVIVAGSNGYWNYRHQADAFHAYQILIKNGMPAENIILFAYDDVANNSENPFRGKVFNKPDPKGKGVDVYEGVKIDYKGKDVNPENFLAVLEGDAAKVKGKGTGRVLKSGENDLVFINFADHGATGLIAFPSGELYADDLIKTFKTMNEKKMYKQLVFYLEACESGSMFDKILPDNIRVYASSAANPYESSWGCYCGSEAIIDGQDIGSCLGDLYSVVWMEDSDLQTPKESIESQFGVILKKVDKSHPMEWGDKTFEKELITDFQGNTDQISTADILLNKIKSLAEQIYGVSSIHDEEYQNYLDLAKRSVEDSRDIKLNYLFRKTAKSGLLEDTQELQGEVYHRQVVDTLFREVAMKLNLSTEDIKVQNIEFSCLKNSVNFYKQNCENFSEYTLKYVKYLAGSCSKYTEEKVISTLAEVCGQV